ncbi:MAG TPA: AMP-binding protein, partial [Gemmatimonadaceae bacterium]|nr:AMP-binding protein [Gemmatimonadaceae bacterium]
MIGGDSVFPDWVASRAATTPDKMALVVAGKTWSYGMLEAETTGMAQRLRAVGVTPGDRIATLLHNGPAAAIMPHAALRLGATLVPLNTRLTESELAWQLGNASPRLVVTESRLSERLATAQRENPTVGVISSGARDSGFLEASSPRPFEVGTKVSKRSSETPDEQARPLRLVHDGNHVAALVYTSGTTGRPRGVMLTVGNFWWNAIGSALNCGTHQEDRWLVCLPLFHVGGLSIIMRAAIHGIAAQIHDRFDAHAVNAAIDDERVTIVSLVAVMLQRVLDARGDKPFPRSLRYILLGGGPAPAALLDRCSSLGARVLTTYGMTETCSQVVTMPPDERAHSGSAGKALYPNEIRIVMPDGAGARPDAAGEILVRGPVVMAGYADEPELNARTIVDGWLHTGDLGRLDASGFLYVLDRRDDLIISGAENIY